MTQQAKTEKWTPRFACVSCKRKLPIVDELYEALLELLRVDDEWHGSVNSEMASARNAARTALSKARGESNDR